MLALSAGFDRQADLAIGEDGRRTYRAWTADLFLDRPVGRGAVTVEASYTDAHALPLGLPFAGVPVGADSRLAYLQGGFLLPWRLGAGRLQLYGRAERLLVSDGDDTSLPSAGLNYLVRGHDLKLTADWSRSPRGSRPASSALTLQTQVGFDAVSPPARRHLAHVRPPSSRACRGRRPSALGGVAARAAVTARGGALRTPEGEPGKGSVKRSYRFVLGEKFLHERNVSTYPPQPKNEKGEVHEHWSFFSHDRPAYARPAAVPPGRVSWTRTVDADSPLDVARGRLSILGSEANSSSVRAPNERADQ